MPLAKKLIEVALPLDAINRASAREKSIRHGHPSTLHLVVGAPTTGRSPGGHIHLAWSTTPMTRTRCPNSSTACGKAELRRR